MFEETIEYIEKYPQTKILLMAAIIVFTIATLTLIASTYVISNAGYEAWQVKCSENSLNYAFNATNLTQLR